MTGILVIGGANLDIKAKSFAPAKGGTSNQGSVTTKPGGVARNIAHNLGRLGVDVTLLTALGNDATGTELRERTKAAGVTVDAIFSDTHGTGTYVALLDHHGELINAVNDMQITTMINEAVIISHAQKIMVADYAVADCNLELATLQRLASLCRIKLIIEPVSVDKCARLKMLLRAGPVFLATPNLDQIEALTATRDPAIAIPLLHDMGLENIVIHAGGSGAIVSNRREVRNIPTQATVIEDVTGAGDAATAGLLKGLMDGLNLFAAAELGQHTAAKVIASSHSTLD